MSNFIRRLFSTKRPQKMPSNTAAWVPADKQKPFEIKEAEYTRASSGEIVVKNAALSLNIVDFAVQTMGSTVFPMVKYPAVVGCDVAGEVVEVGPEVKHIKVGDRVLGKSTGPLSGGPAVGAFQHYTVVDATAASLIPAKISYSDAVVIPLAFTTASVGLFAHDYLHLSLPTAPSAAANGETVLIWGGSSSVGTNAIQAATAAGYEVITTASPKNWDYVRKLGAAQAFDYNSESVVPDIVAAFKGKKSAGALAIGQTAAPVVIDIVSQIQGNKIVACANMPPKPDQIPEGVTAKFIMVPDLKKDGVQATLFGAFLPKALEAGSFVPSPPAEVVGKGLEALQANLDKLPAGVSAKKLVVEL